MSSTDLGITDAKGVGVKEGRRGRKHANPSALKRLGFLFLINSSDRTAYIFADSAHICSRWVDANTARWSTSDLMCQLRDFDQCFARHTTSPGAIAADAMFLDECDAHTELGCKTSPRESRRTSADDNDVELFPSGAQGARPPSMTARIWAVRGRVL